jgi:hypothetical protein
MSEIKSNMRTSFYIATTEGYISSDFVVGIKKDGEEKTRLQILRGGDYFASATVEAPADDVLAVFEENGYKIISDENLKAMRKKETAPAPR